MGAIASQITSLTIVYSSVYSGTDQRKHQSSASLAFVREIHRLYFRHCYQLRFPASSYSFIITFYTSLFVFAFLLYSDVLLWCASPYSSAFLQLFLLVVYSSSACVSHLYCAMLILYGICHCFAYSHLFVLHIYFLSLSWVPSFRFFYTIVDTTVLSIDLTFCPDSLEIVISISHCHSRIMHKICVLFFYFVMANFTVVNQGYFIELQWRHYGRDGVSNHWRQITGVSIVCLTVCFVR